MNQSSETPIDTEASEPAGEASRRRFRPSWSWEELAPVAHLLTFLGWLAFVLFVAMVRVRPWNEWESWRRWLRAGERGWEILAPGILLGVAVFVFVRAQALWRSDPRWSPGLVGLVILGVGAGVAGVFWGLFTLDLRPFLG